MNSLAALAEMINAVVVTLTLVVLILSVRQNTLIRLALAHSTWSAHEATAFAYKAAGTAALRAGTIQHLFRDMHAGTQHITSSPPVYAAMGRELGGMAKGKKWLFLQLIDQ